MIRSVTTAGPVLAILLLLTFGACTGTSPESLRKEAQANADKYVEFLKAGDFDGAYAKTFHSDYRRELAPETFNKFRKGIAQTAGQIENYQVVHYDADPSSGTVVLTYAIKYTNLADVGREIVKLKRENGEWRITSVEPKIPKAPTEAPTAPVPIPGRGTGPAPPAGAPSNR